tara:strand:- start:105 stop:311 length:207 start_codon:yes stop_codon:yes gene_type:complete
MPSNVRVLPYLIGHADKGYRPLLPVLLVYCGVVVSRVCRLARSWAHPPDSNMMIQVLDASGVCAARKS